ncbi:MAG: hypothetical protein IKD10_00135 [Lentisphaeria bacterium]|nr:hypothetical protein [Lentisphaeria bacterium]
MNILSKYCYLLLLLTATIFCNGSDSSPEFVSYEKFGARGDGKTDDQKAIAAAHEYANKNNLPVKARKNARYYIGSGSTVAVIRTDTDFNHASFIIDDRNAKNYQQPVFRLEPDKPNRKLKTLKSLKKNQSKINMTFSGKVLLLLQNNKQSRFNRLRSNRPVQKSPQRDLIIVDKQGIIDKTTPLLWDFDSFTECLVHYIPPKPITVKNGSFTTIDNGKSDKDCYHKRNIEVLRSNVVFDNIIHRVRESNTPHSYMSGGFIAIRDCAYITVKNSAFTGDKRYAMVKYPENRSGGYDLTLWRATDIKFINCRQLNDIYDDSYWGIIGSNYCKNLVFDNCRFSRVDAHMGVYNATIKNCTLGHQGISVTGYGTLLVKNTSVKSKFFINLRADYGSFWHGKIIIRNCQFARMPTPKPRPVELIGGVNTGSHDFGYTCYMPENIEIDGLKINDQRVNKKYPPIYIFSNFNNKYKSDKYKEQYPYIKTRTVTIKNLKAHSKKILISFNKFMFKKVKIVQK